MITAHPDKVPISDVLPVLAGLLPLKEDYEENAPIYSCIVGLYQAGNSVVQELTPKLVPVFAAVLGEPKEQLDEETRAKLVETVKYIAKQQPALIQGHAVLAALLNGPPYLEQWEPAERNTLIYGLLGITGWTGSRHGAASEFLDHEDMKQRCDDWHGNPSYPESSIDEYINSPNQRSNTDPHQQQAILIDTYAESLFLSPKPKTDEVLSLSCMERMKEGKLFRFLAAVCTPIVAPLLPALEFLLSVLVVVGSVTTTPAQEELSSQYAWQVPPHIIRRHLHGKIRRTGKCNTPSHSLQSMQVNSNQTFLAPGIRSQNTADAYGAIPPGTEPRPSPGATAARESFNSILGWRWIQMGRDGVDCGVLSSGWDAVEEYFTG
ncbi:hypothetical protein V490_09290 [Pseudogymnoascus sp. VKM F-3557]|nr:hypothetical protein V490_09290 [Pseudogymnoascus sp. VKM F-3557]